jgi:hypothetical protein
MFIHFVLNLIPNTSNATLAKTINCFTSPNLCVWVNYTYIPTCAHTINANGTVIFQPGNLSNLTMSGILCTITGNFTWFWGAFVFIIYAVAFFIFGYLRSTRLLLVVAAIGWIFATILLSTGLIQFLLWGAATAILVICIAIHVAVSNAGVGY